MTEQVLSPRQLNRALLARQLLLDRSSLSIGAAIDQVGGLQTQYAPSGYVGLWSRLTGFRRENLTAALEDREVIQGTLLRGTIHMVSRHDYWHYAMGVRRARRAWWLRVQRGTLSEAAVMAAAAQLRAELADGPRTVAELGDLATGFVGNLGLFVDLVRVPPSGTWEHRRADRLGLAEDWVGPPSVTEQEAIAHLVRAYLRAFGPAAWKDISLWAGVPAVALKEAVPGLELVPYRDESGRELVDLAGLPLPHPDTPAPVRFLPHWDAALLVHARRSGLLPEHHRPRVFHTRNPFSVGTVLVDGSVAAAWTFRNGRIVVDPYEAIARAAAREIEMERSALEAFHQ